jgi:two-component system sensor histidine kinase KdpD
VALEEMIRDVVRRLSRMLGDVKVELCLAPNLPLVDVDYVQMDQVLTNLLENAARYAPSGSTVHFSAAPVADMVEVTVSDHGPGIAPEALAVLFEPFRTAAGSASTGVGLAICKAIVEAHGGVITGGQAPEGGAQLRFTMPVRHG